LGGLDQSTDVRKVAGKTVIKTLKKREKYSFKRLERGKNVNLLSK